MNSAADSTQNRTESSRGLWTVKDEGEGTLRVHLEGNWELDQALPKPEDILAATENGIYVQSLSGGSVNPTTGVFNFTCREAYLIENGRKTAPVKGATLIGNCLDIIANIDAVGDDLAFGPGICGKGQSCEVSAGQPTVRIRGINVGGSRRR